MMIIKTHKDVVTPFTNDPADFKGLRAKQPRNFVTDYDVNLTKSKD